MLNRENTEEKIWIFKNIALNLQKTISHMKKVILFLTSLIILVGCSDYVSIPESDGGDTPISRAIISRNDGESVTNPNLISDWENVEEIVLNSSTQYSIKKQTSPWVRGSNTALDWTFCSDIKKDDGWLMLFHTFKDYGLDAGSNYMCFYNIFTGMMKIFYYLETPSPATSASWVLTGNGVCRMLDNPSHFSLANDVRNQPETQALYFSNQTNIPLTGFQVGWNGFEFWIPSYSEDYNGALFNISAIQANLVAYDFTGMSQSHTNGTVTSVITSDNSLLQGVANASGSAAKTLMDSVATKFLSKPEALGFSLADIITNIGSSNYAGLIKSGIKLLFGRSMTTTLYSKSEVVLTTNGMINLDGSSMSQLTTSGLPLNFDLSEILNPYHLTPVTPTPYPGGLITNNGIVGIQQNDATSPNANGMQIFVPLRNLGVWTLTSTPKIYFNRFSEFHPTKIDVEEGCYVEFAGSAKFPSIQKYDVDVMINPHVKQYVESYDVDVNFVGFTENHNSQTQRIPQSFNPNPFFQNGDYSLFTIDENASRGFFYINDSGEILDFNDDTEFYYDWGNVYNSGHTIALVTVKMNIRFRGRSFTIEETRAYRPEYLMDDVTSNPSTYHHPPTRLTINRNNPFWSLD